jgi:hypothetical protein
MYGTGTESQWWLDATVAHGYSRDGWSWHYSGVAFGNATADNINDGGALLHFTDGSSFRFTRFERPHLVLGGQDLTKPYTLQGDPAYLSNAAQYGLVKGGAPNNGDACYTTVFPTSP